MVPYELKAVSVVVERAHITLGNLKALQTSWLVTFRISPKYEYDLYVYSKCATRTSNQTI
jgi:hypothetical protein